MTEEQLFQKLYQIIKGTDVTYKQVDSDLDEEGDVTIFFSGLETADHESDNFIKKENMEAVIAKSHEWFAEIKDRTDDEQYCCGFEIGDQIIDINIYDGEKLCEDNKWHCEVIECFDDENGCHARGDRYQYLWSIDKGDDNAPS